MRTTLLALAMLASASAASAEVNLSVTLGIAAGDSLDTETYTCDGAEPFSVQYVNSGANSLAILPVGGEVRIFVNVVSGSGAKYASGAHVWWTKGDTATLENELEAGSLRNCQVQ